MSSQHEFLKGLEIYAERDEAVRVSFANGTGNIDMRIGPALSFLPVRDIPETAEFNPGACRGLSHENRFHCLFECLVYHSLEAYVLASYVCRDEPVNLITRHRMTKFMADYLWRQFNSYIRRSDIEIICDDVVNPPSVAEQDKIKVVVVFKPTVGPRGFYPIEIVRA